MQIPTDAIIPEEKLTRYLLIFKAKNDKSKFLRQAGFVQENWEMLRSAIRLLAASSEAVEDGISQYGTFYRVEGELIGANGLSLSVILIWLRRQHDGQFQFITLKPRKDFRNGN